MSFIKTDIPDVVVIEPRVYGDDRGIAFDDKSIAIDWKIEKSALKLSGKDLAQPTLKDVNELFDYSFNYYE